MIKQVWVAINPEDSSDIEICTSEPNDHDHYFYPTWYHGDGIRAEWKAAMLVVEDNNESE